MNPVDLNTSSSDEADILQSVIGVLRNLDPGARTKILQTVATFFQVGLVDASRWRSGEAVGVSAPSPSFVEDRSMQPRTVWPSLGRIGPAFGGRETQRANEYRCPLNRLDIGLLVSAFTTTKVALARQHSH